MRKINQAGIELIESFEGLRLKAYTDSVGVWTIGWGHTGPDVSPGLEISRDQAEDLLRGDLAKAERGVEEAVGDRATDNQFAACVSLAFNIGVGAFKGSTLAKMVRQGQAAQAADQFLRWNKAGGQVLKGLTRRREAERKLFLTPDDGDDEATADTQPLAVDPPADEPAPPEQATTTVEHHDFVQTIAGSETAKEIAKSGVTSIGTRVSTGLATGGLLSAADAFITQHYAVLIFAGGMILLAVIVVLFILWHKSQQQKLVAQINSDRTRQDIKL